MELRRTRIGSSEIGALLGIDPYKSALDVFMEKTLPPDGDGRSHQTWGLDLEPAIIRHHARHMNYELQSPPGSLVHPSLPLVCTPDALALTDGGHRVAIQAKNDQGHGQTEWGEPGTDDAPLLYVAQVTVELGVLEGVHLDVLRDDLVVSIRGAPPVCYPLKLNKDLFGEIGEVVCGWVRDHLDTGKPPDGSTQDRAEYVRRKYAKHDLSLLEPTPHRQALVQAVSSLRASRKALEEELNGAENALKEEIGEASGIAGLCTWKSQKRSAHAVKESTSRVLRLTKSKEE